MKEPNKIVTSIEELFAISLNIGTKGHQSKQKEKRFFVQFDVSAAEVFAKGCYKC